MNFCFFNFITNFDEIDACNVIVETGRSLGKEKNDLIKAAASNYAHKCMHVSA